MRTAGKSFVVTLLVLTPFLVGFFAWLVLSQPKEKEQPSEFPVSTPIRLSDHIIRLQLIEFAHCNPADVNSGPGIAIRAFDNRDTAHQATEITVEFEGQDEPLAMSPTGLETNPLCGVDKAKIILAKITLPTEEELHFLGEEEGFLLFGQ